MNEWLGKIDEFVKSLFKGTVDHTRDGATYAAASEVERATFGKVFAGIEGVLVLIMIFGCAYISNMTQGSTIMQYICGIAWVVPFIAVVGLIARFRNSLFVKIRGMMNRFLGG